MRGSPRVLTTRRQSKTKSSNDILLTFNIIAKFFKIVYASSHLPLAYAHDLLSVDPDHIPCSHPSSLSDEALVSTAGG